MTVPSNIRLRAAAIAEQFRHVGVAHPSLDMVGIRGREPEGIAVMRLDELLGFQGAVVGSGVPADEPFPPGFSLHVHATSDAGAGSVRIGEAFGDLMDDPFTQALIRYDLARANHRKNPTRETMEAAEVAREALKAAHRDEASLNAAKVAELNARASLAEAKLAEAAGAPGSGDVKLDAAISSLDDYLTDTPSLVGDPRVTLGGIYKAFGTSAFLLRAERLRAEGVAEAERDAWRDQALLWKERARGWCQPKILNASQSSEGLLHLACEWPDGTRTGEVVTARVAALLGFVVIGAEAQRAA